MHVILYLGKKLRNYETFNLIILMWSYKARNLKYLGALGHLEFVLRKKYLEQ